MLRLSRQTVSLLADVAISANLLFLPGSYVSSIGLCFNTVQVNLGRTGAVIGRPDQLLSCRLRCRYLPTLTVLLLGCREPLKDLLALSTALRNSLLLCAAGWRVFIGVSSLRAGPLGCHTRPAAHRNNALAARVAGVSIRECSNHSEYTDLCKYRTTHGRFYKL